MPEWVVDILKAYGLAGVVIFALAGTVVALWRRLAVKDAEIAKLHAERAEEREKLVILIEGGNQAAALTATATEKRNDVITELGDAITSQATAIEKHHHGVQLQTEMLKEKFNDFRHVVDSFGESNRVISGLISEVRNGLHKLESTVNQVAITVASLRASQ